MAPSLRGLLLGRVRSPPGRRIAAVVPLVVWFVTFAAYAVGVFRIEGGVVFIPGQAALLGVVVVALLAARGAGLLHAWLTVYGALLGYAADHYLLGLSSRSWLGRLEAFLGLDGLAFLGVEALVLGTLAWVVGRFAARGVAYARRVRSTPELG